MSDNDGYWRGHRDGYSKCLQDIEAREQADLDASLPTRVMVCQEDLDSALMRFKARRVGQVTQTPDPDPRVYYIPTSTQCPNPSASVWDFWTYVAVWEAARDELLQYPTGTTVWVEWYPGGWPALRIVCQGVCLDLHMKFAWER